MTTYKSSLKVYYLKHFNPTSPPFFFFFLPLPDSLFPLLNTSQLLHLISAVAVDQTCCTADRVYRAAVGTVAKLKRRRWRRSWCLCVAVGDWRRSQRLSVAMLAPIAMLKLHCWRSMPIATLKRRHWWSAPMATLQLAVGPNRDAIARWTFSSHHPAMLQFAPFGDASGDLSPPTTTGEESVCVMGIFC